MALAIGAPRRDAWGYIALVNSFPWGDAWGYIALAISFPWGDAWGYIAIVMRIEVERTPHLLNRGALPLVDRRLEAGEHPPLDLGRQTRALVLISGPRHEVEGSRLGA